MAGTNKPAVKVDIGTLAGLILAVAGIVGGLLLEGGKLTDVAQITAALIVLSGTMGAVMVSTPFPVLRGALSRFGQVFLEVQLSDDATLDELIGYAAKARKSGLVSLEPDAALIHDTFLKKALTLAVDGVDMNELRDMMRIEIDAFESRAVAEAKVFESAGGYSPTVGIIGAVMGLIQVMKNLANIEEVGHGIAVAFVATVYGVGIANIVLLPAAAKMRSQIRRQTDQRELMVEGVIGIIEGLNPKLLRSKLEAYLDPGRTPVKRPGRSSKLPATAAVTS